MCDITKLILTKYYGYDADPENTKFLTTYVATYDPKEFCQEVSNDPSVTETTEDASDQGTINEIIKDEVDNSNEDSTANKIVRSSRAILNDDTLDDEINDFHEYDPVDHEICATKDFLPQLKEKIDDRAEIAQNDSTLGNFEEIHPDNVSDVSSIPMRKKLKKKSPLTTAMTSSREKIPPRKLPACNGIFLDLTNISLTEFPINMLANLPNLRMLYLENNSLTSLPEELFSSLKLLQWLDVRNNKLTGLPKSIKYHASLETILLEGNLFEELPLELCLLPNLKSLQTSRNPLKFPSADILALGFAATMNFLRIQWNKLHPEEAIEPPKRDGKAKPSTILCSDPPISRTISKTSRLLDSSSTDKITATDRKISVREKSWNYRPSNRCENQGIDEELEARLLWINKVKNMLIKQSIALQKVKDRDALSDWRRNFSSYEKSMNKAANRTEEDIPFAIDLKDLPGLFKSTLKMPIRRSKTNRRKSAPRNINEKLMELYESLNHLQEARKLKSMSPRSEQKLLLNEINKLTEVQNEIEDLRRHNETSTDNFEGSGLLPDTQQYNPPPSIII